MTARRESDHAAPLGAGLLDRSDRARIEVAGPDRGKFLHNLTTSDVKRLAPGRGQEAFVTNPQGKTLGYVTLLAGDDRILLRTEAEGLPTLLAHLRKYGIFDDVAIEDETARTFELHLAGPRADDVLRRAGGEPPPVEDLAHHTTGVSGALVWVVREAPTGLPGLTLIGPSADASAVAAALRQAGEPDGMAEITPDLFEVLRIEAGTPLFGRDVSAENLPQEIARDDRAICFVKGCYLGQETVARIDALGHVNKLLRGLRFPGAGVCPPPGTVLELDGKAVGTVTSSADSPGWGMPVALGYVRTAQARAGTELHAMVAGQAHRAVVCDLPMFPVREGSS